MAFPINENQVLIAGGSQNKSFFLRVNSENQAEISEGNSLLGNPSFYRTTAPAKKEEKVFIFDNDRTMWVYNCNDNQWNSKPPEEWQGE